MNYGEKKTFNIIIILSCILGIDHIYFFFLPRFVTLFNKLIMQFNTIFFNIISGENNVSDASESEDEDTPTVSDDESEDSD